MHTFTFVENVIILTINLLRILSAHCCHSSIKLYRELCPSALYDQGIELWLQFCINLFFASRKKMENAIGEAVCTEGRRDLEKIFPLPWKACVIWGPGHTQGNFSLIRRLMENCHHPLSSLLPPVLLYCMKLPFDGACHSVKSPHSASTRHRFHLRPHCGITDSMFLLYVKVLSS